MHPLSASHPKSFLLDILTIIHYNPSNLINIVSDKGQVMSAPVPAIERAIRVLYLFKNGNKKEYGVSEISRLLRLNKSTAHNILNTLTQHKFLEQNEVTRGYRLGPALAELGSLARSQLDVREVARSYLRRLMERTHATLLLGVFDGAAIIIVDKEEPLAEVRVSASIGMKIPFCAGAFGQAFLAYLPTETVDRLLDNPGLRAFTPTSITDPGQYRAALAIIRQQGYAVDDSEEYLQGVGAIAVPVFTPALAKSDEKEIAAVMTLVNFSSFLSPEKITEFTLWMLEAGREISAKLGAPPDRF
jgi:DNA-binding IclR family transcriptional regulator